MEEDAAIRHRVCSPTCVAMVLAYHGYRVAVADLAREMLQPELDLYGVWPAAIRAASRRGVGGYLLRFPDWAAAAWCLERGMPVIASVRYARRRADGRVDRGNVGPPARADRLCRRRRLRQRPGGA
jgi:hypothetical protein